MVPEYIKTKSLYPRTILTSLAPWLHDKQALVLIGSRQVGKTSLLFLIIQQLLSQKIPEKNILYLDLENFDHLNLLEKGIDSLIQSFRI